MILPRAFILLIVLCACRPPLYEERIAQLEARFEALDADLEETWDRVCALAEEWNAVALAYDEVAQEYRQAREAYLEATSRARAATKEYNIAAQNWEQAQARWKLYRIIIETAVAIDSLRYQDSRGAFSCEPMSTAAFRRLLISQGVDLVGMDIDHIVPRSLGGADHPANYQILDSSLNRSLGAKWDLEKCALAGQEACGRAVAVSSRCGSYQGPWF